MRIDVFAQAAIKMVGDKVMYFDPYLIKDEYHDADYIFITHDHYDHYDEESINNIKKDNTKIILPMCLKDKPNNLVVEPNKEYEIDNIKFKTIPSYNLEKPFHPREKEYVGYLIELEGLTYYIMGDTDVTSEALEIRPDVCFVPIGGKFTMDYLEAVDYINKIKPKKVIPIHYGSIIGDITLGKEFKEKINNNIEVEIKIGG
jgi:L-ascorbate metabolism protein UlaG (beta-lactamase superfamily)